MLKFDLLAVFTFRSSGALGVEVSRILCFLWSCCRHVLLESCVHVVLESCVMDFFSCFVVVLVSRIVVVPNYLISI